MHPPHIGGGLGGGGCFFASFFAPKKVRNYHSYEEGFFQSLRFVKASKLERGVMEVLQLCCIKQN